MIKLSVPIEFAIDYLSILKVKYEFGQDENIKQQGVKSYVEICNFLNKNNLPNLDSILRSQEYKDLYSANLDIFKTIDEIHGGKDMTAKDLDLLNHRRSVYKQKIHDTFFSNFSKEIKIGY